MSKLDSYLKASEHDRPAIPTIAGQVVQAVDNPDRSIDETRSLIE